MPIQVEVVACSVSDCLAIERAGADRIELCSGIVAGGVTPSSGLLRTCLEATALPVMAMVRPREGGFKYSDNEFATMTREVEELLEAGAHGVVFGILLEDGRIDVPRTRDLVRRAGNVPVMCHRAFDVTPDPFEALGALVDCGVSRVLSSGQTKSILEGLDVLEKLMERAGREIEVQPCEGIRPGNVSAVLERLNPRAIHFGPFQSVTDPTSDLGKPVTYGSHMEVEEETVRGVVEIVRAFA